MGMLLRFSARTPRAVPAISDGAVVAAKVLLFTGVRYDRTQDMSEPKRERPEPRTGKGRTKQ